MALRRVMFARGRFAKRWTISSNHTIDIYARNRTDRDATNVARQRAKVNEAGRCPCLSCDSTSIALNASPTEKKADLPKTRLDLQ
jgi:hypothetical protein